MTNEEQTLVFKAYDGHRAKNLDAMSEELLKISEAINSQPGDGAAQTSRDLYNIAQQMMIIAEEVRPLYDCHATGDNRTTLCGLTLHPQLDYVIELGEDVTCKKCHMRPWFVKLDKEFVRRTGCNWHNLCGDQEPLDAWYAEGTPVEEIVTEYIEKYDLTEI
jgi:hypothetical protein